MLIHVPEVLTQDPLQQAREMLLKAAWEDGRGSAGYLSQQVKRNQQLPDSDPVARKLGELILLALDRNALFTSAALPLKILPPQFNRYSVGESYGRHIDGAIRPVAGTVHRVRTDLSATLFLSAPEDYDGGELRIEEGLTPREVKFPAGDMVLYPSTSVHRVNPVTRGERLASFFWIQSMVRDETKRIMLFEMDKAIQNLAADMPGHASLVDLAGVYHNLLRAWADV